MQPINFISKIRHLFSALIFFTTITSNHFLLANEIKINHNIDISKLKQHSDYSKNGADTCLKCHDSDPQHNILEIFKTSHGSKTDKNSPFAQEQCEACHGPAGNHSQRRLKPGETRDPMISFNPKQKISVIEKNKICENCHQRLEQSHWQGSPHQMNDVACSDCHKIHVANDPIKNKILQLEICGTCHQTQKLAANRFSTHPIKNGQLMGCVGCHSPHGSVSDKLLVAETINDTCYSCHAEKRGPFLWEHEPASEDCTLCHAPHGSNHQAMLVQKAPYLCQNCHSSDGHPSLVRDNNSLTASSAVILGRSCTNCHSQIHGSNHPSAIRLQQ